jgi:hypothetical protein
MGLQEDIAFVGRVIDDYASGVGTGFMQGVAGRDDEPGVPPEMRVGEVNHEGWVAWRVLPSALTEVDVRAVEEEYGVEFPPLFRAYLLARHHLFDQVHSRRYNQLIFMTDVPSRRPLQPLRDELRAWRPLIDAGFVPFAEWGDQWGPMCFDVEHRAMDGDCPIVWMDHERVIALGPENSRNRANLLSLVQPLYGSFHEMLSDVFPPTDSVAPPGLG